MDYTPALPTERFQRHREHVCRLPSPLPTPFPVQCSHYQFLQQKETRFPFHRTPSNLEFPFFLPFLSGEGQLSQIKLVIQI